MKDYETLDVVPNLLTLDEFIAAVKDIAEENGVDKDNVRIASVGGIITVEEEIELDD